MTKVTLVTGSSSGRGMKLLFYWREISYQPTKNSKLGIF